MKGGGFLNLFIQEEIYLIGEKTPLASNPGGQVESKARFSNSVDSKKFLVVTTKPLKKVESDFLFKVFAAVKLEQQDIQLSTTDTSLEGFETAFFFGTTPKNDSFELYQKVEIDQCTVVVADSLQQISQDQGKKKALWSVLKECFGPTLL